MKHTLNTQEMPGMSFNAHHADVVSDDGQGYSFKGKKWNGKGLSLLAQEMGR